MYKTISSKIPVPFSPLAHSPRRLRGVSVCALHRFYWISVERHRHRWSI